MVSFMSPFLLLVFLFGGEDSLSGYVSPEQYWENRGVAFEVQALSEYLIGEERIQNNEINSLVAQLGAEAYADREAASSALAEIGEPARSLLLTASRDRDPEVSRRAKELLQKIEQQISRKNPLDEWMALYSLSRMEDPAARAAVEKILTGPESELTEQAKIFLREDAEEEFSANGEQILSGFPADTRMVLQARPHAGKAEVLDAIHRSPAIQERLVELLAMTGDLRLRRVTAGLNDLSTLKESGQLTVLLEMNYDPEKITGVLEKSRYNKTETGGITVLSRNEISFYLVDPQKMVVTLSFYQNPETDIQKILPIANAKPQPDFPEDLLQVFGRLSEASILRGAGVLSEKMMENMDAFSDVRQFQFHLDDKTTPLALALILDTSDAETAKAFGAYARQENSQILELLRKESEEWVKPMLSTLETLKIAETENQVLVEGAISSEVLLGTVRMFEQLMQQMQKAREVQIQRLEMQQRIRNQNGVIRF